MSPAQTTYETEIDDGAIDLKAEEDLATELVRHAHLDTFNQEQI